jgi:hypothetical protein
MFVNVYIDLDLPMIVPAVREQKITEIETSVLSVELREHTLLIQDILPRRTTFESNREDSCISVKTNHTHYDSRF